MLRDQLYTPTMTSGVADEQQSLMDAARTILNQSGYKDITPDVEEFKKFNSESAQRMQEAMAASQKDPRNLMDKLTPAILGLGAIVDIARKKRLAPQKLQAYLEQHRQAMGTKSQAQRQKLIDAMKVEELAGSGRAANLNATAKSAGMTNANVRTSIGVASQQKASKEATERSKAVDPLKKLELERIKAADQYLQLPANERSDHQNAIISSVYPNYKTMSADEINAARLDAANSRASAIMKMIPTDGMSPGEVIGLYNSIVESQLQQYVDDGQEPPSFDMGNVGGSQVSTQGGPTTDEDIRQAATTTQKLTLGERRKIANQKGIPIDQVPEEVERFNILKYMMLLMSQKAKTDKTPAMTPNVNLQGGAGSQYRTGPYN